MYLVPDLFTLSDVQPDSRIVYAPLLGLVIRVNRQMASLIEGLSRLPAGELPDAGEGIESLVDLGILSTRSFEHLLPRRPSQYVPTSVSLFLTSACNLACTYCHSSANARPSTMPWPMVRSALDLVANNALRLGQNRFGITLHGGGEPTVCFGLLQRSVQYARELASRLGLSANVSVGTNGFTSPERATWLAENIDEATLSIDGLRQDHDGYRRSVNGESSYDRILATARIFDAHSLNYGVRMTVAQSWVQRLPEAVDSLFTALRVRTIQAEPVFAAGRARGMFHLCPSPHGFVQAFRRAKAHASKHGRTLTFSAARLGWVTDCFCNAVGHSFAVTPTGAVTCCYEVTDGDSGGEFLWGHFDSTTEQYVFDETRRLAQTRWAVPFQPGCSNCFCKWTCAGDCPAKRNASAPRPDEGMRCVITKALTHDQIINAVHQGHAIRQPHCTIEGTCT
jgi:uncharacterized protein